MKFNQRFFGAILVLLFNGSCRHDNSARIEAQLTSDSLMKAALNDTDEQSYVALIETLTLSEPNKVSLLQIQSDLAEDLLLLSLKEKKITQLLTLELLKSPYNRPEVEQLMRVYVKNAKAMATSKLRAMLTAKNTLRYGLSKNQLKNVEEAKSVLYKL